MAYYYRAMARTKLAQNALAINDLRKSLEIDPNFKQARDKLELLLKSHKY
jgi:hypothetical protein